MKYLATAFVLVSIFSCKNKGSINGDNLFAEEKYEEAIKAYTSYLDTDPDNVKGLYNRGRSYEEMGRLQEATPDFEKVIELDSKNVSAYLSLAKISYNKRNYNKVLIYTSNAIDLNENSEQAHFLAGRAEHQLGYLDQAVESYNNAIAINYDFGEAYLYRGAVKVGKHQLKSACEDFKLAQSLNVPEAIKAITEYCM